MLRFLILYCLFSVVAPAAAEQVQLLDLSGTTVSGDHLKIGQTEVSLDGSTRSLQQVDWITFQHPDGVDWSDYSEGVLLQDASWIPVSMLTASEHDDHVLLTTPFGTMEMPLEHVAAWGSYEELQAQERYDALLLHNDNKPYGELYGIRDGKVLLKTDIGDKPLPIPLTEIKALRLRTQKHQTSGLYCDVYTHPQRPPMKVLPGAQPRLALVPSLGWDDWSLCDRLQVIGGQRVFLGALEPDAVEERGQFGKVWHYSVGSNIDGSPLFLNGRRYVHGMVLHSYARLTWKLDGRYRQLHALIGISDQLGQEGDCAVRIIVDGERLWQRASVRGGNQALPVRLDLTDKKELSIEIDFGHRYDIGDHCALADAWLQPVQ